MRSRNPILPGCLVLSRRSFNERLEFAQRVGNSIHVDVIDNEFIRGHTLPINDWPKLSLEYAEAHLMVQQPLIYLKPLKQAGITRAIVHLESSFELEALTVSARNLDLLLGFAINPDTDLGKMKPVLSSSNYIQVMGVNPGRTGQDQLPQTESAVSYFDKISNYRLLVSVDGGVNGENIARLKAAGADYFVASAALYNRGSWEANYQNLMAGLEQ